MNETPTTVDVATILAEFAQLKAMYVKTVTELEALKKSHQALLERYRALEQTIFFRGREKPGSPEQGLMGFMTPPPPEPPYWATAQRPSEGARKADGPQAAAREPAGGADRGPSRRSTG